mgnify:CR=1 FL=1
MTENLKGCIEMSNDCGKPNCKKNWKDCYGKPDPADHCMHGMFCIHCASAFCTVDRKELKCPTA